jgi:hypothetical protein
MKSLVPCHIDEVIFAQCVEQRFGSLVATVINLFFLSVTQDK